MQNLIKVKQNLALIILNIKIDNTKTKNNNSKFKSEQCKLSRQTMQNFFLIEKKKKRFENFNCDPELC